MYIKYYYTTKVSDSDLWPVSLNCLAKRSIKSTVQTFI